MLGHCSSWCCFSWFSILSSPTLPPLPARAATNDSATLDKDGRFMAGWADRDGDLGVPCQPDQHPRQDMGVFGDKGDPPLAVRLLCWACWSAVPTRYRDVVCSVLNVHQTQDWEGGNDEQADRVDLNLLQSLRVLTDHHNCGLKGKDHLASSRPRSRRVRPRLCRTWTSFAKLCESLMSFYSDGLILLFGLPTNCTIARLCGERRKTDRVVMLEMRTQHAAELGTRSPNAASDVRSWELALGSATWPSRLVVRLYILRGICMNKQRGTRDWVLRAGAANTISPATTRPPLQRLVDSGQILLAHRLVHDIQLLCRPG